MSERADGGKASTPTEARALVVGVEATRLVHDVRGIGRSVRAILPRLLRQRDDLRLVLFVKRRRDISVVRRRIVELTGDGERVDVRHIRELARFPADVVWYPWNVVRPAARRAAVVVTMNDVAPIVWRDPRWWKWWKNARWRRLYGDTARTATLVLAISRFTAEEIRRVLEVGAERLRITYLAADDAEPPDPERDDAALARLGVRRPYLLTVGARDRRKNLTLLTDAMSRVVQSRPDATLVLAGPRRADRRSPPEPSWQRSVGFVSDADLASLYRCATALVAPSSYEGFGLPVLEAMRLGAPVICLRTSSLPEVAGDAALWIEPDDAVQLAAAIERVLGDDALQVRMRAASLVQAARFSWDETARGTLAAFDEATRLARAPAERS